MYCYTFMFQGATAQGALPECHNHPNLQKAATHFQYSVVSKDTWYLVTSSIKDLWKLFLYNFKPLRLLGEPYTSQEPSNFWIVEKHHKMLLTLLCEDLSECDTSFYPCSSYQFCSAQCISQLASNSHTFLISNTSYPSPYLPTDFRTLGYHCNNQSLSST